MRIEALAEVLSLWPPSARVSAFDFLVPRGDIGSRAWLHFCLVSGCQGYDWLPVIRGWRMRLAGDKRSGESGVLGMNVCPFWYERGLIGAVLGLLPGIGAFFIG